MNTIDLLKYILPHEILDYFEVIDVKERQGVLTFYLDEKKILTEDLPEGDYESKGFSSPVRIQDFPIRDRAVFIEVRRRKWIDKKTGKVYSRSWDLTAAGTKYTKEFGAFLKELAGQ
jgi:hypothetical protein